MTDPIPATGYVAVFSGPDTLRALAAIPNTFRP